MSFCTICSFCKLRPTNWQQIHTEQHHALSSDPVGELDDLHKFSLNSLTMLLVALTALGSTGKAVLPVVLALLVFTISLRSTVNACFLQNYPALSKFLHAVPLLGAFCVAGTELVLGMRSPALAIAVLLLSVLPFVATVVHHARGCEDGTPLPIRMRDPQPTMSSNMTVMSA